MEGLAADIEAIEAAFVAQWANFGQGPGGTWHDDGDLVWTEGPPTELPFAARCALPVYATTSLHSIQPT